MPKHLKRRRCAGEAVLSAYYDGARGELSRRENFIISIESLRYLISSLGKESLVKTSSASEKKLKLADGKGKKYPYGLWRRRFRDTRSTRALYMHMARYAFSQTLLVHLASDLIAANYNRSFLRSPLLFTVQRIRARACVYVRVGEHRARAHADCRCVPDRLDGYIRAS